MTGWSRSWGVMFGLALVLGCSPRGPKDIRYGEELCDYCHMTITDPAFAGQLVTRTGKVFVFDDLGGLAAFVSEERIPRDEVESTWVNLFSHPGEVTPADSAVFLRSERLRSPMGSGLAAFGSRAEADGLRADTGGDLLSWDEVVTWAGDHRPGGFTQ